MKGNVWGEKCSVFAQLGLVSYVQVCVDGLALASLMFVGPVLWCEGPGLGRKVFGFCATLCG